MLSRSAQLTELPILKADNDVEILKLSYITGRNLNYKQFAKCLLVFFNKLAQ